MQINLAERSSPHWTIAFIIWYLVFSSKTLKARENTNVSIFTALAWAPAKPPSKYQIMEWAGKTAWLWNWFCEITWLDRLDLNCDRWTERWQKDEQILELWQSGIYREPASDCENKVQSMNIKVKQDYPQLNIQIILVFT